jgi:hypothetical protein
MNELIKYKDLQPGLERAPDFDIQHNFLGFGTHPSECNIKIWCFPYNPNILNDGVFEKAFVLFTDLGKGTSVTNASEDLVEWVYYHFLIRLKPEDCIFAETYQGKKEGVDIVAPVWNKGKVIDVNWLHLGTFT